MVAKNIIIRANKIKIMTGEDALFLPAAWPFQRGASLTSAGAQPLAENSKHPQQFDRRPLLRMRFFHLRLSTSTVYFHFLIQVWKLSLCQSDVLSRRRTPRDPAVTVCTSHLLLLQINNIQTISCDRTQIYPHITVIHQKY